MTLNLKDEELLSIVRDSEEYIGSLEAQRGTRFSRRGVQNGFRDLHERGYLMMKERTHGMKTYQLSEKGEQAV